MDFSVFSRPRFCSHSLGVSFCTKQFEGFFFMVPQRLRMLYLPVPGIKNIMTTL